MKRSAASFIFLFLLMLPSCDTGKGPREVLFSYKAILNEEFRFGNGREIPVTIESSVERDGILTPDGQYIIYSSDRQDGNFNLFLRKIGDISLVRLTTHPSADISPALAPDARTIAYVSMKDDPEGDIFVGSFDPGDAIELAGSGDNDYRLKVKNITSIADESGRIQLVGDLNPAWSPDGKTIAFSSKRGGANDIWTMSRDGGNKKQITRGGAMYPSFSPDGKKIVCISYRSSGTGDLCVADLATGKEEIVPAPGSIKLYPLYTGSSNEIIYTAIESDTDGNRTVDLKDSAVLYRCNVRTGKSYRLTLPSASSFAARWYPVYETERYRGVILYSSQTGTNINISILPDTGIIPTKENAQSQLELANKYLKEDDDAERHLAALHSVYDHFGGLSDVQSGVYSSRAMFTAALFCKRRSDKAGYAACGKKLSSLVSARNPYAPVVLDFLESGGDAVRGIALIRAALEKIPAGGESAAYLPYLKEDLADLYLAAGMKSEAADLYRRLLADYSSFERSVSIERKLASLTEKDFAGSLSAPALVVLEKGQYYQVNEIMIKTLEFAQAIKDPAARTSQIGAKLAAHAGNRQIQSMLLYAMGKAYYDAGDLPSAEGYLKQALEATKPTSMIGYLSNMLMGRIGEDRDDTDRAASYFHSAVSRYRLEWKDPDFRPRLDWLTRYYEERVSSRGNASSRAELFKSYTSLMTYIHRLGRYEDVYNRHSSIAHVLYIDAMLESRARRGLDDAEKGYRDSLAKARMDFDKAHMYGLAYVISLKALDQETANRGPSRESGPDFTVSCLKESVMHCDWALFIDDSYIDPYILQSWINQYLDIARESSSEDKKAVDRYFQVHLLEKNIPLLEKALVVNNEEIDREKEGDIHLNLGNTYFLLMNYARAAFHYGKAAELKRKFGSEKGETLFDFHRAYCLWQQGETTKAGALMEKVIASYESQPRSGREWAGRMYILYRYMALFNRIEKRYTEALAWYEKIARLCDKNSIEYDRARYVQEMAVCSMGLGDYESAEKYLKRSWDLLAAYPDDTKKYPLRIKFFGLGNAPLMNLNPDSVVIGDSSLFRELDAREKKLLNLSMQADLAERRGNLKKAAQYLEQKISLSKKGNRDMDRRAALTGANNLGWISFKRGMYPEALKYFSQARSEALEKKDLEGVFASTMNLTDCYASIIENKNMDLADARTEIDTLAAHLNGYRSEYFDARFAEEMKALKKKARAEGRKVRPAEIESLKETIRFEEKQKNLSIDIALATLNYYRAELAPGKEGSGAGGYVSTAAYLCGIYSSSLELFVSALKTVEEKGDPLLQARVLLNAAACYEKLFQYDNAYESLIDAVEISEKHRDRQLMFKSYLQAGRFLARSGKEVEGDDYRAAACEYFGKALALAAETPAAFTVATEAVRSAAETCAGLLVEENDPRGALLVADLGGMIVSALLYYENEPALSDADDEKSYRGYLLAQETLVDSENELSGLIAGGAENESEKYRRSFAEYEKARMNLSGLRAKLDKRDRPVYAVAAKSALPSFQDISLSRIVDYGGTQYLLTLFRGRVGMDRLTTDREDMGVRYPDGAEKRYFLLNAPLYSLLAKKAPASFLMKPVILIPAIDRIESLKSPVRFSAQNPAMFTAEHRIFTDPSAEDEKMLAHPVAITQTSKAQVVAAALYGSRYFRPECLVACVKKTSLNGLVLLSEAAVYAGVPSLAMVPESETAVAADIARGIAEEGAAGAMYRSAQGRFFAGAFGTPAENRPGGGKPLSEIRSRIDSLSFEGKTDEALVEFMRCKRNSPVAADPQLAYEEARAYLLNSRFDRALEAVDKILAAAQTGDRAYLPLVSMKIYLHLLSGDSEKAGRVFASHRDEIAGTADAECYAAILSLCETGNAGDGTGPASWDKKDSLIEKGRLRLLEAEYLYAFGLNDDAARLAAAVPRIPLSRREKAKLYCLSQVPSAWDAGLPESLVSLCAPAPVTERWANEARALITGENDEPARAAYFLCLMKGREIKSTGRQVHDLLAKDVLDAMAEGSPWLDLAPLALGPAARSGGDNWAANETMNSWCDRVVRRAGVPLLRSRFLFARALSLLRGGFPGRALVQAQQGMSGAKAMPDSARYELLFAEIENSRGAPDKARARCAAIDQRDLGDADRYWLLMIEIRNELARLSKLASADPSQGQLFEKLYASARSMIEKAPAIFSKYGLIDDTRAMFDQYIRFKMMTGRHGQALSSFLSRERILAGEPGFVEETAAEDIAGLLGPGELFFCAARNGSDVFYWMISHNARKASVARGGYGKAQDIVSRSGEKMKSLGDIEDLSSALESLFPDMPVSDTGTMFVLTDSDIAPLPLELLGKKKMICEMRPVVFMLSTARFGDRRGAPSGIRMMTVSRDISGGVEAAALRETGVPVSRNCSETADCVHLLGSTEVDDLDDLVSGGAGGCSVKNREYRSVYVALPASVRGDDRAGFIRSLGSGSPVIVSSPFERDINTAMYSGEYYSGLTRGLSVIDSHFRALQSVSGRAAYSHPAYWQGIRLYFPGFPVR